MLDLSWRLEPAYRPAGRPRSPSRAARLPEHPKPPIRLEWRPVFHRFPAALQATSDGTCVAFSQRDGAQKPDETTTCQCCLDRSQDGGEKSWQASNRNTKLMLDGQLFPRCSARRSCSRQPIVNRRRNQNTSAALSRACRTAFSRWRHRPDRCLSRLSRRLPSTGWFDPIARRSPKAATSVSSPSPRRTARGEAWKSSYSPKRCAGPPREPLTGIGRVL